MGAWSLSYWTTREVSRFILSTLRRKKLLGTSLGVQWLRLHAPNAGAPGSIRDQGTRSHTLQLRVHIPKLKIPRAASKTPVQPNKRFFKKRINPDSLPQAGMAPCDLALPVGLSLVPSAPTTGLPPCP